jgi:hypothetical protein
MGYSAPSSGRYVVLTSNLRNISAMGLPFMTMNDSATQHTWQHTIATLALISSSCRDAHRKQGLLRTSDERFAATKQTPGRVAPRSPASAYVEVLERRSPTLILVYWCDATSGRYGDQLWSRGVAPCSAICALSGARIRPGDRVYRPRIRGRKPSNADRSILESAVTRNEQRAALSERRK